MLTRRVDEIEFRDESKVGDDVWSGGLVPVSSNAVNVVLEVSVTEPRVPTQSCVVTIPLFTFR